MSSIEQACRSKVPNVPRTNIKSLPTELLQHMLSDLEPLDLIHFAQTCHSLNSASQRQLSIYAKLREKYRVTSLPARPSHSDWWSLWDQIERDNAYRYIEHLTIAPSNSDISDASLTRIEQYPALKPRIEALLQTLDVSSGGWFAGPTVRRYLTIGFLMSLVIPYLPNLRSLTVSENPAKGLTFVMCTFCNMDLMARTYPGRFLRKLETVDLPGTRFGKLKWPLHPYGRVDRSR
ncbi:uncharacterized protein KY384_001243 [Bacidia gigantensis]|uniref:uncharacterized protein n=1 Tax=Bacidia gigantensis TaxID=2732470 RepID=UPI001D055E51|nr:uncharacterized protein KY384_001243 [Bacidia gigantensis]KAG8534398.1 hypothetical protein KY384_001243 [Bacidia gigantensis]